MNHRYLNNPVDRRSLFLLWRFRPVIGQEIHRELICLGLKISSPTRVGELPVVAALNDSFYSHPEMIVPTGATIYRPNLRSFGLFTLGDRHLYARFISDRAAEWIRIHMNIAGGFPKCFLRTLDPEDRP